MHLLRHAPRFDSVAAESLVSKLYGITASASPLPSERDQNFLIEAQSGDKFVLKIANSLEARSVLEAQNQVLTYLENHVSFCPRIIPSLSGEWISETHSTVATANFVRLVSYLPGKPFAEVRENSPELLRDLGRKLGCLDRALSGFDHPAVHREFHWDLAGGLRVIREYGATIADPGLSGLVDGFGRKFEGRAALLLPQLRRSVIHNDANDYNVLVSESDGQGCVVGLIDFGDMVHSYTVGDLAAALAYVLLEKPDPLATAAQVVAGYHVEYPLQDDEIDVLFELVIMRLCMSVCLAASQRRQRPDNEYLEISQHSITTSLPLLAAIDSRWATSVFRTACASRDGGHPARFRDRGYVAPLTEIPGSQESGQDARGPRHGPRDTLVARRRLLGRNLSVAYKVPVKIVRGSMQYLYDDQGRQYLDAYNNVAHVGHCHPRIVKAGQDQMAVLNTNTRYLHDLINAYAERLTSTLPSPLRVCFFVNSGSEANELALRLARAHTNARDLIVLEHGYHGNTTTLIDISPYKHDGPGGHGPPSWVHTVPLPDLYRGRYRDADHDAAENYARHISETIRGLHERGIKLAGFIAESLPSVAGQIVLPAGYLTKAYTAVRDAGGVCIADEVQTGYGRTGAHFWGFESYGVVPDIVVLGKPIGNGHPIGAVVTTAEIAASFDNGMEFFSTFGGNTVSSAIGLEVLDLVLEEKLQERALNIGTPILEGLRWLMDSHEMIGDVRGAGMFLGVDLVCNRETREPATAEAKNLVNRMREKGILLGTDGPFSNVIKIRPPLPFSAADGERLIETMDRMLGELKMPAPQHRLR